MTVEADHVEQIRHSGAVGEAVPGDLSDFHLVFHPKDFDAYRVALASALVSRWKEKGAGDRQPGGTLSEKLSRTPGKPIVAAVLASLANRRSPLTAPAPGRLATAEFHRGISLAMVNHIEGGYHAPSVERRLERLAALGGDAVSLMPFAYQGDSGRPEMRFLNRSPGSETDLGMLHAARRSREAGFRVLWKPQVWIPRSWPGEIRMTSEEDWAVWWRSYRRFLVHQAMLAEWADSELLSIGVELGKTLDREREWRELIDAIRLFFGGGLTYSANWYGDFEEVPFWDRMDFLGVDAYYPLADSPAADKDDLVRGVREMVLRLDAMTRRTGKRILLTEVGYAARRGAWVSPHEEGGEYSPEHQALAYKALFEGLGRPPWLAGLFVWKAFSADRGRPDRADFRFLGRPAEDWVRRYFQGAREPAAARR